MKTNSTGSVIELETADIGVIHKGLFMILLIAWTSDEASGKDIAADDDFALADEDGFKFACKRAEATGDDFGLTFSHPIAVNGLKLTKLDGGVCRIYIRVQ